MGLREQAINQLRRWREHPATFVREVFQVEPDPWQLDILENFPTHQRIGMKACKGPGKTALLAWLAWNFLVTRAHPKVAATSISWDNLADGLWTEMSKWQSRSEFLKREYVWTKTRISFRGAPETWWMSARTWARGGDSSQQANTLAGLHADDLLFLLDEAGGIPDAVMAAAEAGLANDHTGSRAKIVMAGNPTHLEGPLYRAATTERHMWYLVSITADPKSPKRTPRVSAAWAQAQIDKYGKDNPWVLINVFGEFPPNSVNSLLGVEEVEASMQRRPVKTAYDSAQKRLGVDCARFGDDRTVIFPRQGLMAYQPVEMRNARTNEIAARVMQAKGKWNSEIEFIDDTGGFGAGVVDSMIQAGASPMAINFSGKAEDSRYINKRAEMYFRLAEWVKRGGALPRSHTLTRELTTPTYWFSNGKLQLESKDQIKERLGFSPDEADALALTFAWVEMPGAGSSDILLRGKNFRAEYDPYDPARLE